MHAGAISNDGQRRVAGGARIDIDEFEHDSLPTDRQCSNLSFWSRCSLRRELSTLLVASGVVVWTFKLEAANFFPATKLSVSLPWKLALTAVGHTNYFHYLSLTLAATVRKTIYTYINV